MGDDDVICLSSDDEVASDELPKKKPKLNDDSRVFPKSELDNNRDANVSIRKRNLPEARTSGSFSTKKPKIVGNGDIEEIVIGESQKVVGEKVHRKREDAKKLETNNTIASVAKPDDWRLPVGKLATQSSAIQKNSNDSGSPSVADVVHNFFENAKRNDVADCNANGATKIPGNSSPKTDRRKIAANEASNAKASPAITTPTTPRIGVPSDPNNAEKKAAISNSEASVGGSSVLSEIQIVGVTKSPPKSGKNPSSSADERSNHGASSERLDPEKIQIIEPPKAVSSKITSVLSSTSSSKQLVQKPSDSPEVQIVHSLTTSKPATSKIPDNQAKCSSESSEIKIIETEKTESISVNNTKSFEAQKQEQNKCRQIPRCIKIPTANGVNGASSKPVVSQPLCRSPKVASAKVPQVVNCEILTKEALHKLPNLRKETVEQPKTILSKTTSPTKVNSSSSKFRTQEKVSVPKPTISASATPQKRVTPLRISESTNKLNSTKSNNAEPVTNVVKDETSKGSFAKNAKVAIAEESDVVEVVKSSNVIVAKSGDSEQNTDRSGSSKQSRAIVASSGKESIGNFEPKPGCSKTPDKMDNIEKPQLIVKSKKPAFTVQQDTFSMFLSLCLQAKRNEDMKKIVAKLKRYYDEMDPAYARSRDFEDLLNEKRDRINESAKLVYVYTSHVMDEMKRRRIKRKGKKTDNSDNGEAKVEECAADNPENEEGEDDEEETDEARRRRHVVRKIERAMKECQKRIQKLEEAEVGSEDDSNSNYIKLDRYQVKMIQLWNKLCEYTSDHADAGRAYLRPKHVRVTQIPVVDQAINSFINSRLGSNRRKSKKVTSFIEGIIFPDFVDILQCIAKANDEQNLGLTKAAQEKIARSAFTQLGEHLQKARRNDYWDTFSMHLENQVDPATRDEGLSEKLAQNQEINKARTAEVFEEFVRKQEKRREENRDENADENEDDDDEDGADEDEEAEEDDADKKSDCEVVSDLELQDDEDDDSESVKNDDHVPSPTESIAEEEKDDSDNVEDSAIPEVNTKTIEPNNNPVEVLKEPPAERPNNSIGQDANENEVHLVEVDDEDVNKPEIESRTLLRIRSFAKPPESWQASQEDNATVKDSASNQSSENQSIASREIETIDVMDEDAIPLAASNDTPKKQQLKTLTIGAKTVVVKRLDRTANNVISKMDNLPKVIVVSNPATRITKLTKAAKKKSPIVVRNPNELVRNKSSTHTNVKNLNNFAQTSSSSSHSNIQRRVQVGSMEQLKLANSTSTTRHMEKDLEQVVKQLSNSSAQRPQLANNFQPIRMRNSTVPERARGPQTIMRTTEPQGRLRVVPSLQIPRTQLVPLKNARYVSPSAVSQSLGLSQFNNSQQLRYSSPSRIGQGVRIAMAGNPRMVRVAQAPPVRPTTHLQVLRLNNGQLVAMPLLPQPPVQSPQTNIAQESAQRSGKTTNSCEASVVVSGNKPPAEPVSATLKLRINEKASTTSTAAQQGSRLCVRRPSDKKC